MITKAELDEYKRIRDEINITCNEVWKEYIGSFLRFPTDIRFVSLESGFVYITYDEENDNLRDENGCFKEEWLYNPNSLEEHKKEVARQEVIRQEERKKRQEEVRIQKEKDEYANYLILKERYER